MVPSVNGSISYAGSQLATITVLAGYQQNVTARTRLSFSRTTLNTYALKWDTTYAPIQSLIFNGSTVSENLNIGTSQMELIVTFPVLAAQLAAKQDTLASVSQANCTPTTHLAQTYTLSWAATSGWVNSGKLATVTVASGTGYDHYIIIYYSSAGTVITAQCCEWANQVGGDDCFQEDESSSEESLSEEDEDTFNARNNTRRGSSSSCLL